MICSLCMGTEMDPKQWETAFTVINGHAVCVTHSVYAIHQPAYRAAVALALTRVHHVKD